jgi:hypothetical protein
MYGEEHPGVGQVIGTALVLLMLWWAVILDWQYHSISLALTVASLMGQTPLYGLRGPARSVSNGVMLPLEIWQSGKHIWG